MISQVDMAEEFQVCSANWWNSPRTLFGSSPCSWAVNDFGNLGWLSNCDEPVMDMNNTVISNDDSAGSASDGSCTTFPDAPKTKSRISNGSLSTDCWNQDFLHESGRSEENYSQIMNYRQENWINPKNFCEDLSGNPFKQVNQDFSIQHQPLNSTANSIESCAATCEEIPVNFPLNPSSYSYTSSLMQNLLGQDNSQPHVLSFLDDQEMNYLSEANYGMNPNELLLSSLPKSSSMVIQPSRQKPANHLPFSNNNTRFWNATPSPFRNDSSNFIPSTNSPILPSIHNSITNNIPINISAANNHEGARDVASVAKKQNSSERAFKRPRIETPSPLPTFKVRKEKLGDRITAIQQLVSPFGKTDTASVLHEAIEYIKFLHDQVKVLSTPYLKNGSPPVLQHQQAARNKPKDREGLKQDLKGRGLCLVPISSTSPVAADTTSDFWTHTFGVSFR